MAQTDRERWDRRHREDSRAVHEVPGWLDEFGDVIPSRGRALDLAAGAGRVACWLAARGLEVLAADVSPVGLERARTCAAEQGLRIEVRVVDLEQEPPPDGPFDVISCFHYLQRDLFPGLRERLAPHGVFICEISTLRNLERHAHPSRRFLLEPNELLALCAPLEIVYYREGWIEDRARARVVARRS